MDIHPSPVQSSPVKSTRFLTAYCTPTILRTLRFHIALPQQTTHTLLHHDYRNDSTASQMCYLYPLHLSLSVTIPTIQPSPHLIGD
ncbi:MAG: hypothetical protein KZQ66_09525 [Candidatus Thiodiazotropha sp. (ex Lucinoma aequizonata)]|nr:hypothetical protein [Candidatus Thiodiazotropha sp. (ex Lucinoma aequizonata)]MCU7902204.1 hypothetical protein [Candidatus Thiodiazotropha sp. (ex Lucinoma aequizonata)]MCU7908894.1 hypothetical protein [Candidatus Thiodiazotropha sp. (ex Lucinoma aequizonata)]